MYGLLKKFFALCNSHIAIHLFMVFFFWGYSTIALISVIGILLGIITTAIIIKKDMSIIRLSIYNASVFVISGIILLLNISNAYFVISVIVCLVLSLLFGIKQSDVFYERLVFALTNPVIHVLGYLIAISYEMSKEPFHFP